MAWVALQRCASREVLSRAVAPPCAGEPAHVLHAAAPVPHPGKEQGVQPLRGDPCGPQEGELLSACSALACSHPRAADVLVGSHETSSGLCAAACTLCARDADQAEQAPLRGLDAGHPLEVLAKVSQPPHLWQLTMSGSWPTWSANEGRLVCA